jgi:hypothetical protein
MPIPLPRPRRDHIDPRAAEMHARILKEV